MPNFPAPRNSRSSMSGRLHSWLMLSLMVLLQIAFVFTYDASSMQFHPDGRVLQIEYSKDAVKNGGPVGAYRCKDGIVIIAVRKAPISKFLVNPLQKVFQIDSNIVIAGTGLLFDANVIVDVAKRISLQHRSIFCDEIPVESLCEDLSEIMHKQTTGNSRPFGVSLIVAGIDRVLGPQLYVLDPEGSLNAWNAVCIGKKSEKVMESLVVSFGDIAEKNLCVADMLPRFQECLRKHFPSKLMASADTVDESMTKKKRKELDMLSENEDSPREDNFSKEDSFLPETLKNDKSKRRNRNGIEEDSDDTEYWDFEVTSIMLNSEDEICILPMRSHPHPSDVHLSDSITA